jgi:hypothetical protein
MKLSFFLAQLEKLQAQKTQFMKGIGFTGFLLDIITIVGAASFSLLLVEAWKDRFVSLLINGFGVPIQYGLVTTWVFCSLLSFVIFALINKNTMVNKPIQVERLVGGKNDIYTKQTTWVDGSKGKRNLILIVSMIEVLSVAAIGFEELNKMVLNDTIKPLPNENIYTNINYWLQSGAISQAVLIIGIQAVVFLTMNVASQSVEMTMQDDTASDYAKKEQTMAQAAAFSQGALNPTTSERSVPIERESYKARIVRHSQMPSNPTEDLFEKFRTNLN